MNQRFSSIAAALAMAAVAAAAPAYATDLIPYEQYRAAKLADLTAPPQHDAVAIAISPDTDRRDFHVKFTGEHRPVGAATADFIAQYMRTAHALPALATCKEEYRFTEGGKDYWLPVEAAADDEMTSEMSPGDSADLYANVLGFAQQGAAWTPVIVVEEVQTPN